jgi:hypothetical protein
MVKSKIFKYLVLQIILLQWIQIYNTIKFNIMKFSEVYRNHIIY